MTDKRVSYLNKFYLLCSLIYIFIQVYIIKIYPAKIGCDAIAYFNIAKKYRFGFFSEALNAYWSPLISWLSVPFFFFDEHTLDSIRVINVFAGLLILYLSVLILRNRFQVSAKTEVIGFISILIFSLVYQLDSNTPDFLSIACLLSYLYLSSSENLYIKKRTTIFLFIAAAATVFCKGFFIYYIIAHLLLFSCWNLYSLNNKKNILIHSAIVFFSTLFIIAIWVTLLSNKYDKLVINSAGSYNSNLITPKGFTVPHYNNTSGLLVPAGEHAICSWEDPTYYPVKARNPFASYDSFRYQLDIYKYNFNLLLYMMRYYSFFGIFLIPILAFVFFIKKEDQPIKHMKFFIASAMLVITGYFLILMEERHLLPAVFIMIITTLSVFDHYLKKIKTQDFIKIILLSLVALMFLKNTVLIFNQWTQRQDEYIWNKEAYQRLEEKLAPLIHGKKLAGYYDSSVDVYMIYLAYKFDAKYYGQLGIHHNAEENEKDLKKNDIDYLFYLGCQTKDVKTGLCIEKKIPFYLQGKKLVCKEDKIEMSVYDMKNI